MCVCVCGGGGGVSVKLATEAGSHYLGPTLNGVDTSVGEECVCVCRHQQNTHNTTEVDATTTVQTALVPVVPLHLSVPTSSPTCQRNL